MEQGQRVTENKTKSNAPFWNFIKETKNKTDAIKTKLIDIEEYIESTESEITEGFLTSADHGVGQRRTATSAVTESASLAASDAKSAIT